VLGYAEALAQVPVMRTVLTDWFATLPADLAKRADAPNMDATLGTLLVEVLSDSCNELFCAGLLATRLRRFGAARCAKGHFWVRSEWCKFDLSYGLAPTRFSDWNAAWVSG
jgi:hypothetical protein